PTSYMILLSSCAPLPPALPSSPTRRSSDLVSSQFATPNSKSTIHDQTATATTTGIAQTKISPAVSSRRILEPSWTSRRANSVPRSEEHTSELQSLRQLVCRLLLEKKKANIE